MDQIEANYKSNSNTHSTPAYSPNPLSPVIETKKQEQDDYRELSIPVDNEPSAGHRLALVPDEQFQSEIPAFASENLLHDSVTGEPILLLSLNTTAFSFTRARQQEPKPAEILDRAEQCTLKLAKLQLEDVMGGRAYKQFLAIGNALQGSSKRDHLTRNLQTNFETLLAQYWFTRRLRVASADNAQVCRDFLHAREPQMKALATEYLLVNAKAPQRASQLNLSHYFADSSYYANKYQGKLPLVSLSFLGATSSFVKHYRTPPPLKAANFNAPPQTCTLVHRAGFAVRKVDIEFLSVFINLLYEDLLSETKPVFSKKDVDRLLLHTDPECMFGETKYTGFHN